WDSELTPARLGGEHTIRFGTFLPDAGVFDAQAFNLPAVEAALLDPQHRLLLELSAEVFVKPSSSIDDGASRSLQWHSASAFVGASSTDYGHLAQQIRSKSSPTAYDATAATLSVASGRLSYTFGLRGPAITVDTACSSSLAAGNCAVGALRAQACHSALVGGVNLALLPDTPLMFQAAGMLSREGRCKTLSAEADGYVRAEACGVMLLTTQPAAFGDMASSRPCAVVAGSAVNQDGRSSALTAPNGPAQSEVLMAALKDASLEQLSALAMHGTATPLGDPIGGVWTDAFEGQVAVGCAFPVRQKCRRLSFPLYSEGGKNLTGCIGRDTTSRGKII
ncbi:beta-ketoacyl synthase, partial [Dunaliella salina]